MDSPSPHNTRRFYWEERSRKHLPGSKMLKLNKVETIEQNLWQQHTPSHFLGNREVV